MLFRSTVDWDVTNTYGGRELAAFMDGRSGVLIVEFPAESGETTGPKINITGYCNKFTPMGTVLSEGTGARSMAELVYKISGITYTAAV